MKGQKDFYLPYQLLTSRDGIYFSSIVLSMWDNIHGPKVLMTWKGEGSDSAQKVGISDGKEKFGKVVSHSLVDIIIVCS